MLKLADGSHRLHFSAPARARLGGQQEIARITIDTQHRVLRLGLSVAAGGGRMHIKAAKMVIIDAHHYGCQSRFAVHAMPL